MGPGGDWTAYVWSVLSGSGFMLLELHSSNKVSVALATMELCEQWHVSLHFGKDKQTDRWINEWMDR